MLLKGESLKMPYEVWQNTQRIRLSGVCKPLRRDELSPTEFQSALKHLQLTQLAYALKSAGRYIREQDRYIERLERRLENAPKAR
jgi:hypothetical protein